MGRKGNWSPLLPRLDMLLMPLLAWKKERVGVATRLRRSKGMALPAREGEEEVADRIVPSFSLGRAGIVCAPVVCCVDGGWGRSSRKCAVTVSCTQAIGQFRRPEA